MALTAFTVKEALALRKSLPAKKKRAAAISREIKKLSKEREELQGDLRHGEWIRIHKGRPYLRPYGSDYENLEKTRKASIGKRAVDEFFNVQLDAQKPFGFHSTQYGNVTYRLQITEPEAKRIAIAWVLDGKRP